MRTATGRDGRPANRFSLAAERQGFVRLVTLEGSSGASHRAAGSSRSSWGVWRGEKVVAALLGQIRPNSTSVSVLPNRPMNTFAVVGQHLLGHAVDAKRLGNRQRAQPYSYDAKQKVESESAADFTVRYLEGPSKGS
jgi:hypothetical protein